MPVDRKGPRFRRPAKPVLNQEFYREIKKNHPGLTLSNNEIKDIILLFNNLCVSTIANTRDGLELPSQLGFIIIGATKTSLEHFHPLAKNYQNWETGKKMCKIYYTNYPNKYKFKFSKLWGFAPGREMKKQVSTAFKANHTKYHIIGSGLQKVKVAHLFKQKQQNII